MGLPKRKKKKKTHKYPSRMNVSKLQQLRHRTWKTLKKNNYTFNFYESQKQHSGLQASSFKASLPKSLSHEGYRRTPPPHTSPVKRTLPPLLSRPSLSPLSLLLFFFSWRHSEGWTPAPRRIPAAVDVLSAISVRACPDSSGLGRDGVGAGGVWGSRRMRKWGRRVREKRREEKREGRRRR